MCHERRQRDNDGQHNQAKNIVDDRRTQNGRANFGLELPQIDERLGSNGDAGRRQDVTNEDGLGYGEAEPSGQQISPRHG